jgi:hypothetical protein
LHGAVRGVGRLCSRTESSDRETERIRVKFGPLM